MKNLPTNKDCKVARRGQSGGKAGAAPVTPKRPYTFPHAGIKLDIHVESDGRGCQRYYFDDTRSREPGSRRHRRVRRADKLAIEQEAKTMMEECVKRVTHITFEESVSIEIFKRRLAALDAAAAALKSTPEAIIESNRSTLAGLPPGFSYTTVLERGRNVCYPPNPKTLRQLADELMPSLKKQSDEVHCRNMARHWKPLLSRYGDTLAHDVTTQQLEELLQDVGHGEFLTQEQYARALKQRVEETGEDADGLTVFSTKTLRHHYDAWRRLFIRAEKLKALTAGSEPPTWGMEKLYVDPADGEPITVPDYQRLLPTLDREELCYVVLLIADIRSSETENLDRANVIVDHRELATEIRLAARNTKGKPGYRRARNVSLNPTHAALLYTCLPRSGPLIPSGANAVQIRVSAKAEQVGIEWEPNFIRRAHDTYWYALKNGTTEVNAVGSHNKTMTDTVYRCPASFQDAARFWATLTPNVPEHLQKWVNGWLDRQCHLLKGRPLAEIIGSSAAKVGAKAAVRSKSA